MSDLCIKNCQALISDDNSRLTIRKACDITIRNGRIAAIQDTNSQLDEPAENHVIHLFGQGLPFNLIGLPFEFALGKC